MAKTLIAVMLLVGCAVGQDSKPLDWSKAEMPLPKVCYKANNGGGCMAVNPGDCYRVKQDGTLEKVAHCDNEVKYYNLVEHGDFPPEPVDVPAVMVKDDNSPLTSCKKDEIPDLYIYCEVPRPVCADKSRILLTAEDGKHWCHKVQP